MMTIFLVKLIGHVHDGTMLAAITMEVLVKIGRKRSLHLLLGLNDDDDNSLMKHRCIEMDQTIVLGWGFFFLLFLLS